jgi:hypothetical protein
MSNPTSNFGWQMPTPTDLVTSLPADFEVFGQAVDTSMADLKGGTTGQILSKATNTDMDFTWIANDQGDITGVTAGTGISGGGTSGTVTVTNSMATAIDAKGDLIAGTGADTFARLPVGTNGYVLVADSVEATGLKWTAAVVGDITAVNVTSPITGGGTSGDVTVSIQDALTTQKGAVQLSDSTSTTSSILAATPTAVKSAYDLANAAIAKSTLTTAGDTLYRNATVPTRLGIGTAGQVLTVNSGATAPEWATPSGGGSAVNLLLNSNFALNQRLYVSAANLASGTYGFDRWKSNYTNTTLTFTASTQGQSLTINASGGLQQVIEQGLVPAGTYTLSWTGTATGRVYNSGGTPPSYAASPVTFTADGSANVVIEFTASGTTKTLSKVQFNAGTGTTWALATPTLETELSACQRYFYQVNSTTTQVLVANAFARSTSVSYGYMQHPITMRTLPTLTTSGATSSDFVLQSGGSDFTTNSLGAFGLSTRGISISLTGSGQTIGTGGQIYIASNANAYINLSAEL